MAPNILSMESCDNNNSIIKPDILSRNSENRKEILYEGFYYDVTEFVKIHPGGDIIEFYIEKGEDATAAIGQFHHRSSHRVMGMLKSFKKRMATPHDILREDADPVTMKRHRDLTRDFTQLYHDLNTEGYFDPSPIHVTIRLTECLFLTILGIYLTVGCSHSIVCRWIGTLILGGLAARFGYLMHEGGHNSLTGWPNIDKIVQAFALGVGLGLSSSFFQKYHLRHHAMPQRIDRDSDLETLPLLAFNKKVIEGQPKFKESFFIQNQALLFLAVDTFLVVFYWKLYLHPKFAWQNGKSHQLFFMSLHYLFAYYIGVWPYLVAVWLGSIIVLGNISLSHLHLPLTKGKLHWVEYSLLNTTNVEPSWWVDYWMGYLNYQIEHHLFPTMPQYKNKLIMDRVKKLANKYNILYQSCSYREAVMTCYRNLAHVSEELRYS